MKIFFKRTVLTLFFIIMSGGAANRGDAFDLSGFNPAGRFFDDLEQKIPNLEARGFFRNKTDIALHGKSNDSGLGHRVRDWDFQMIESNAEIEFRYKLSDHLEIINVDHFLYDALYDCDDGDFPRGVEKRLKKYDSFKEIMREFHLNLICDRWFFKLGKQQVVWGKMDGKCIDIINSEDARESVNGGQEDYEWRRIPTWMANLTYFWSDYYLQFILIPDFEPSTPPPRGSVWWYPALPVSSSSITGKRDMPGVSFENQEVAVRFNMVKGGWDTSLIYFYTWDDYPTMFRRGFGKDPVTGREIAYKEPKHTRLHQFGFNVDKGNWFAGRNWVWRMEFLYTLNDYVSAKEPLNSDGVAKRNNLKSMSSIETNWWHGEINTLFQFNWKYQCGYKRDFRRFGARMKRLDSTLLVSISKKWFGNRLKLASSFYCRPGEGSWKFKDTLSWEFSDYITAQLRYTGFSGPSDDIYGMYDKWDNIGCEVKYAF